MRPSRMVSSGLVVAACCLSVFAGAQPDEPGLPPAVEIRLRSMEEQTNQLKEQTIRLKERLLWLQGILVDERLGAGAGVVLALRNELGGAYQLRSCQVVLDGSLLPAEPTPAAQTLFEGSLIPGHHRLAVRMRIQGRGYGLFPYVQGYTLTLKSLHTFTIEQGKLVRLDIVGFEKDPLTTSFEWRPAIRYESRAERLTFEHARTLGEGPP